MRLTLLVVLLLGSLTVTMSQASQPLIPQPQALAPGDGSFTFTADTRVLVQIGESELGQRADLLLELIRQGSGLPLAVEEAEMPAPNALFLGRLPSEAGPEAYTLDILHDGVVLRAGGPDGLTWGLQTLRQLLPAALESPLASLAPDPGRADGQLRPLPADCRYPENNLRPTPAAPKRVAGEATVTDWTVPCVRITDQPRFGWRGVLLDCARHFMDIAAIERLIDLMSLHKLNVLHWHLTEDQGWRLEIKAYPKLTEVSAWREDHDGVRYGGYYTQDDARHIVAYAAARGITVVPEIEMPGHTQAVLAAYPELGCVGEPLDVQNCWGVWPDVFCAGGEEAFTFLETVLEEVLDIFPSEFIHVGGDECPKDRWKECPRCYERIAANGLTGENELQSWFIQRMERWLDAHGRRLIGWDEILEGGLAPGATVQSWRGFEGAVAAARQGHDTVVSPTSHAYFDYDMGTTDLATVYAYDPVPPELTDDEERHVLGGEMNLWTEYAPQAVMDERLFPRLCAMSEVLWSARPIRAELAGRDVKDPREVGRDFTDFWQRLLGHYQRLDRLGVQRADEGRPVTMSAAWDEDRLGWLLAWDSDKRRPRGKARVIIDAEGQQHEQPAKGTGFRQDPGVVQATLMVKGEQFGAPRRLELLSNLALGRPVSHEPETSERYQPKVDLPVTSGMMPDGDYRDGRWLAWEGMDGQATVDLGSTQTINGAAAVCMHAGGRLIYSPEVVKVTVSIDGKQWTDLGQATWRLPPEVMARTLRTYRVDTEEPVPARYVRFELQTRQEVPVWPWAAKYPPWIFLGQLMVY